MYTPDQIWLAVMNTEHFTFYAIGETEQQSRENMTITFNNHLDNVGRSEAFYQRFGENALKSDVSLDDHYGIRTRPFAGKTGITGYCGTTVVYDQPKIK